MLHQPAPEPISSIRETALYGPVKRFLEGLGFDAPLDKKLDSLKCFADTYIHSGWQQ